MGGKGDHPNVDKLRMFHRRHRRIGTKMNAVLGSMQRESLRAYFVCCIRQSGQPAQLGDIDIGAAEYPSGAHIASAALERWIAKSGERRYSVLCLGKHAQSS